MEVKFVPKRRQLKKRENSLVSVQRTTVSIPAVLLLADTIPVDLLAAELTKIYKAKSAGRHIT